LTGARSRTPSPSRSRTHRRAPSRGRPNWLLWLSLSAVALVLFLLAWAILARHLAPVSDTSLDRFDAILVLGYPANGDGNPTPTQLARVTEAVREYERGVAPRLILSGADVANRFVEARVMARIAEAQGIPSSAIFVEPQARDTIQNVCYAARIMNAHGWSSMEVVSSPSHLPRAGLILTGLPLQWRVHAAPPLEPESALGSTAVTILETLKTVRYLVWTRQMERCAP
jgi:uncharacterized SAM-binding protein YcdF (DUF218 family)